MTAVCAGCGLKIAAVRRTADQEALGLYLPATAEHNGYLAEKAKGNLKVLPAGQSVSFHLEAGLLEPARARAVEQQISDILAQ